MGVGGSKIRNELIFAYLAPTVLLLLLGGWLVYTQVEGLLEEELGQRLRSVAETTVGALPASDPRRISQLTADDTSQQKRLRDKMLAVRDATGVRRIFILDTELKSLVDTREGMQLGDDLFELQTDRVDLEQVFAGSGESRSSIMYSGKDGVWYKNGYAPIRYEDRVVAAIGVEGSAEFFEGLRQFQVVLGIILVVGLLIIVLVSAFVARTLTQPIDALVVAARRLGRGELAAEVKLEGRKDEFRLLANAFDEMRRDLLDRDEQMQMMLSGIAHEVRNPLGGMELFCGLLAEDLEPGSQESGYVGKVRMELEYLKRVVNDFLEFARRGQPALERFEAHGLLGDLIGLLMWDLEESKISLVQGELAEGLEVTADKERLRRVLINLIRNAGQASEAGSTVTVWSRELEGIDAIEELQDYDAHQIMVPEQMPTHDGWRAIFVRDEGKGIGPEALEQIFKPFYTTKEKGSGLGLALTRKIIEEHGGALAIASTPREEGVSKCVGTLMVVVLPFKESIEPAKMEIPEGWLG